MTNDASGSVLTSEDLNPSSRFLKHLPLPLRQLARRTIGAPALLKDFASDYRDFLVESSTAGFSNYDQVYSRITATYHNIEKGLSQPKPRPGFGEKNLRLLLDLLALPRLDQTATSVITARHVLAAYLDFNDKAGAPSVPYRNEIEDAVRLLTDRAEAGRGGLRAVTKTEVLSAVAEVSDDFFLTRHSIRQYSGENVDMECLVGAIAVAQKAPAVCNRQNAFVYIADNSAVKRALLEFQGGSRGFSDELDKVLIVTTRLSNYWASGERHQAWVDGGLFSMALIYALHARGLGSVALNWSRSARDSAKLRRLTGMNRDEVIVMLVGVGHLREEFTVPISHRRRVNDAFKIIDRLTNS